MTQLQDRPDLSWWVRAHLALKEEGTNGTVAFPEGITETAPQRGGWRENKGGNHPYGNTWLDNYHVVLFYRYSLVICTQKTPQHTLLPRAPQGPPLGLTTVLLVCCGPKIEVCGHVRSTWGTVMLVKGCGEALGRTPAVGWKWPRRITEYDSQVNGPFKNQTHNLGISSTMLWATEIISVSP